MMDRNGIVNTTEARYTKANIKALINSEVSKGVQNQSRSPVRMRAIANIVQRISRKLGAEGKCLEVRTGKGGERERHATGWQSGYADDRREPWQTM